MDTSQPSSQGAHAPPRPIQTDAETEAAQPLDFASRIMRELVEIGMDHARLNLQTHRDEVKQANAAVPPPNAARKPNRDSALCYSRIARAIGALLDKLDVAHGGRNAGAQASAARAEAELCAERAIRRRNIDIQREIRKKVQQSIEVKAANMDKRPLLRDLERWLIKDEIINLFETKNLHYLTALICQKIGVPVDYHSWRDAEIYAAHPDILAKHQADEREAARLKEERLKTEQNNAATNTAARAPP